MTSLDERRRALEDGYILDRERSFKVAARRDRLLAKWAAPLVARADVEDYVIEVLEAGLATPGDENVLNKILGDFVAAGRDTDEAVVREKMRELMYQAAEQMERESRR
ncbi:DUF1476 domain-containing protein [Rhizobium sp. P32RR-XVIII]|uniref:DUF1476 domain-containing protein n=1 Tax=Rhizobium sp. P32RR-XVIII TaxID=2726738 RepID=UPI0014569899|nr:DUF1476 domain-containing protein [Rhizobium sp. P32RR-XVIII]NLS08305.1 DUF1476 domain-containing protein [Rhizobium sp. P32RR-XVIII]